MVCQYRAPPTASARDFRPEYRMATSTVENYVKQIYLLQQGHPGDRVPMGKLAAMMGVVPGTATSMVKALSDSGLVEYEPRGGIRLTPGGEQLALHVLRRHRLVELFLVNALGLDWSEVHEEAEDLEHAISDKVIEKIDGFLNHPSFDPHGDPIPSAKGKIPSIEWLCLADCPMNRSCRISRVVDQDPKFLQFAERNGLTPGASVRIKERDRQADSVTVLLAGRKTVMLGMNAASKILVEG